MKNAWKWTLLFLGLFLFSGMIALPFFLRSGSGLFSMMGGYGIPMHKGFGLFRGFMMIPMLMVPIAVLGLAIFGLVALFRRPDKDKPSELPCQYCGKPLQEEWSTCPYCGKKKKK